MSDGIGNGWTNERDWVRQDIQRLEQKVDELKDEVAESRGKMKMWHALVLMAASALAGGGLGHAYPESDQEEQIRKLMDLVLDVRHDVDVQRKQLDRLIKVGDER
jgi:uncharacterized coiled-coil protein SlyX